MSNISEIPIEYVPAWVTDPNTVAETLWNDLHWVRLDKSPRNEYYWAKNHSPSTYGANGHYRTYQPQPSHPVIDAILAKLSEDFHIDFDVCFLNGYRNQFDHLGWHADDSPELDDNKPIAIISLGAEREIWFRPNTLVIESLIMQDISPVPIIPITELNARRAEYNQPAKLLLQNGSLCLMQAGMQDTHQHRIPKCDRVCGKRISLTFRCLVK